MGGADPLQELPQVPLRLAVREEGCLARNLLECQLLTCRELPKSAACFFAYPQRRGSQDCSLVHPRTFVDELCVSPLSLRESILCAGLSGKSSRHSCFLTRAFRPPLTRGLRSASWVDVPPSTLSLLVESNGSNQNSLLPLVKKLQILDSLSLPPNIVVVLRAFLLSPFFPLQ